MFLIIASGTSEYRDVIIASTAAIAKITAYHPDRHRVFVRMCNTFFV